LYNSLLMKLHWQRWDE